MRIGGLASGIDTDTIIKDLMNAERIPLDKLEQNKIKMEWQRDKFREINTQIAELEQLISDMRLNSSSIVSKKVTSSMEQAVTATGNAAAMNGSYKISVERLATNAINSVNITKEAFLDKIDKFTVDAGDNGKEVAFYTYSEETAKMEKRSFTIKSTDTIEDVVKKINDADKNVRAFYDEANEIFVMETTRTGKYSSTDEFGKKEIGFKEGESDFFTDETKGLGMSQDNEIGGENALFTYNGIVKLESKENRYVLNGIVFNFHDETDGKNATLSVTNDVDTAFDNIKKFIDKYNELIDTLSETQNETKYRDYPPLTEAQKEDMTDKQIELWEEKARSGLLKGDSLIPGAMTSMRSIWYSAAENSGTFKLLTEVGISTTSDYMDGGKLEINEDLLREKLEEDAQSVHKLFLNNEKDAESGELGLFIRMEQSLESTIKKIEDRAGKGSFSSQMYTIGKQLDDIDGRIKAFEDRLKQTEDRYWRQFTAMERAISMMNNQSAMLMSFGGNG